MSLPALLLLAAQASQPAAAPVAEAQASAAQPVASASASASVRIISPAVISFDAPARDSVKADHAQVQIHRDRAGTVWAQFQ